MDPSLFNTEQIVDLLTLEQTGTDRYRGQSHFMGSPNVFGGQALGQALYAATATVANRRPHSLHSLFILPGNHRLPIDYEVERVRDGGSFSTRRVVAIQEGRRIFVMSASFQSDEQGLSHQKPAPECADPESLISSLDAWKQHAAQSGRPYQPVPVDFRADRGTDIFGIHQRAPYKQVWARAPIALPDDPLLHEALFAYVSDYGLLFTALQPHGIGIGDPRLQVASLDHTIWFHRPFRMDEWLLFATESPNASGGRGLSFAHVYNRQGELVATVAQEGLIRLRDKKHDGEPDDVQSLRAKTIAHMTALVLLPGMDGTGALFAGFLSCLSAETRPIVVSYPENLPLDYQALENFARTFLPVNEPFVLLGESFSGPVAISLASSKPSGLIGVVLSCTYARNPVPWLRPLKGVLGLLPISSKLSGLVAPLLFGSFSSAPPRKMLKQALAKVTSDAIRARLRAVLEVDVSSKLNKICIPILYLQASEDFVVPSSAGRDLAQRAPSIEMVVLQGPHLLLQALPSETAAIVENFIKRVRSS